MPAYEEAAGTLTELKELIQPKAVYSSICPSDYPGLFVGTNGVESTTGIRGFLGECREVFLGAVTLGFQFEGLLKSAGHGDSSRLLLLEACGTELVEAVMNQLEERIREELAAEVSSRFSPGYGDWPLVRQREILEYLKAERIGIYLNEHHLMIPRKSVTAVIKMAPFAGGCSACEKRICDFRE